MSQNNKDFIKHVMENKMLDAKKVFDKSLMEKINDRVADMRQKIAKEYFSKK